MDKFQALTGIPYDKVFVFPHNIGSERILEQLKTYNFDATVNSLSVPMDRTRPASSLFTLRPVTLSFGDFPSVARYGAAMPNPTTFIAVGPWRTALERERCLPSSVVGPVLFPANSTVGLDLPK